jgi:hypothetical protein
MRQGHKGPGIAKVSECSPRASQRNEEEVHPRKMRALQQRELRRPRVSGLNWQGLAI